MARRNTRTQVAPPEQLIELRRRSARLTLSTSIAAGENTHASQQE
jgi:hypothetical protein